MLAHQMDQIHFTGVVILKTVYPLFYSYLFPNVMWFGHCVKLTSKPGTLAGYVITPNS